MGLERPVDVTLCGTAGIGFPLVVQLFALADAQFQFDPPALEIERKWNQGIALQFDLLAQLAYLVENIASILPQYEITGEKSSYGKRSHTSVRQALRRFKMFLSAEKLV